jgi:hypothetical protein
MKNSTQDKIPTPLLKGLIETTLVNAFKRMHTSKQMDV